MTLTDAGPLVALLDKDDANHERCVIAAAGLPQTPLLTTWPCFSEAMYLLGRNGGFPYQAELWSMVTSGHLTIHDLSNEETQRVAELMREYQDRPMDLGDASLIAVAESRSATQIFTCDSDFRFCRLSNGTVLGVFP